MKPKERVYNALNKMPVDRVPVYMWYHPATTRRLAALLEIPERYVSLAMGDDIRQTWVHNNYAMENVALEEGAGFRDEWGVEWIRRGDFNQINGYPLARASEEEISAYKFPYDDLDRLVDFMRPVIENRGDYFIGCDISPNVFEMYWRLRGLEQAMYDLAEQNSSVLNLLDACMTFSLSMTDKAMARYDLDWVWAGDDAGSQATMLMSPAMWRELIKPRLKEIFARIKSGKRITAFHSCGAIRPIIDDLIDIGIDVLNPIQPNCPGMNPADLKREYGNEIAFMGGVDTQGVLPNAGVKEVFKITRELVETMTADGGGYILAASHTVPPETPDENIFAMYAAAGISRESIFDKAADIRKQITHMGNKFCLPRE
jgi:uroporphyrinogen decarboxylase